MLKDVITWAGTGNEIYWIGDASQIERTINLMDIKYDWVFVADINLDSGIEKDWRDTLANSFQSGGRGRGGPVGGMSPGGVMSPNQNTPPMMQDRIDRMQDSPFAMRTQRNSGPNPDQRIPLMRQRPGGMIQSRGSPFQTQTEGILSIYKLVVSES